MLYDLAENLRPRISGAIRWEHAEPMDLRHAVNHITMGGDCTSYAGRFQRPDSGGKQWARYFLISGQGGDYTGEAVVFVYGSGGLYNRADPTGWVGTQPSAFRVAICKHEQVAGAGANPNRGWHPAACKLCGLDMTVDSGD